MEISFYQQSSTPLEKTLPRLIEKIYGTGLRVLVGVDTQEQVEILNTLLWTFSSASFVPHGYQGEPKDHPVWLTCAPIDANVNLADLVLVTNESLIPPTLFKRGVHIFQENHHGIMKKFYTVYQTRGDQISLWKQNQKGGWEKNDIL